MTQSHLNVLVTRPAHQAQPLCAALRQIDCQAIAFPTIEIVPTPLAKQIPASEITIVVSPNAAEFGHQYLASNTTTTVFAIGDATATTLKHHGIMDIVTPTIIQNSEGLLELPQLQSIHGKTITIIKGAGGRELLNNTLRERGANVMTLDVYERHCPNVDSTNLEQGWQNEGIAIVVCTSNAGLANLHQLLSENGKALLQQTPVVVVSQRMVKFAQQLGQKAPILLADGASTAAIISVIKKHHKELSHGQR